MNQPEKSICGARKYIGRPENHLSRRFAKNKGNADASLMSGGGVMASGVQE